jgi:hypothetical protein
MADPTPGPHSKAPEGARSEKIRELKDRSYRSGEVRGKKLPGYLVRSLGFVNHLGNPREEWAALAVAARLSEITESAEDEAIRYTNRHTGNRQTVEREEGTIQKSRQSFVEDLRQRLYKRAATPEDRDWRDDWSDDFQRDYDRIRHAISRLEDHEYLVNEGPAVESDSQVERDRNGRRWSVGSSFRDMPDADRQRRFVRCSGPEPEMDRDALHVDVLDNLERLVAYQEDLHEGFTAGFKAEQKNGKWQSHETKTDTARSHQWTARNGTDRPQYVSVGRWRPEEIGNEDLKGERAVFIPWIVLDIDADSKERCGTLGMQAVRTLSEHLTDEQLEQIVVSYTGGSSIHLRIPAGFFGNPLFRNATAAAIALSELADTLFESDPNLREAIDDRLFHPRQMVRMIGSLYDEDTAPPDNSSHRPKLIQQLLVRPQVEDRSHAAEIADDILGFLRDRHLDIDDVTLDFSGTRPVTITDAPDRTPRNWRVVATTADAFLTIGPEVLWTWSQWGDPQSFEIPDPTTPEHVTTLTEMLGGVAHPSRKKSDTHSVAKQSSTGEYQRALQVEHEGEKWGRDVDKPHLVGRNRAALTVALHRLTYSDTPRQDIYTWNRGMDEPLPEWELEKTFRSAQSFLNA